MSKLFETLQKLQNTSQSDALNSAVTSLTPKSTDIRNPWRKQYYPKFSDYNIEQLLDFLLSLQQSKSNTTIGVLPVILNSTIPSTILETFMHLSANCDTEPLLIDLSSDRSMLYLLNENNVLDHTISKTQHFHLTSTLDNLFHILSLNAKTAENIISNDILQNELSNLTAQYTFSLILLPTVVDFSVDTVQLVRRLDNIVLINEETYKQELEKVSTFLARLKVTTLGVYLID